MKHDHISFINYNMDQLILPLDLEVNIPPNHLSRIVNQAVEQIDDNLLYRVYPSGGRAAYHPKMMLKVIIYSYTKGIYSSRKIATQLRENIYFMWLSNHQQPDFRTINRFRSERMKGIIYETFFSIVDLLHQQGLRLFKWPKVPLIFSFYLENVNEIGKAVSNQPFFRTFETASF